MRKRKDVHVFDDDPPLVETCDKEVKYNGPQPYLECSQCEHLNLCGVIVSPEVELREKGGRRK